MNREIKFRGKSINTGLWSYGDLRQDNIRRKAYIEYEVDPDTIGQYTGLKDKNEKKIFEGDIIKTPHGFIGEVVFGRAEEECTHREHRRKITDVYTTYGWIFKRIDGYTCAIDDEILQGELLGNVIDNPELMK
jgi:hypothetical protein